MIKTLRNDCNYTNTIEAIELDPVIIEITKTKLLIDLNQPKQ
ncbi:hypothetical protein [Winogradskyella sp. Asnod2-B02-A]